MSSPRSSAFAVISIAALCLPVVAGGCRREARRVGPAVPQTVPAGDGDPRIAIVQNNVFEVAQGGRYFGWYGCQTCHRDGARPGLDLADGRWRRGSGFTAVYAAIANGHGRLAFARRIPAQPLWQVTAYVRDLERQPPEKRRRAALDQRAEPHGARWTGPQ